jgi:hypothetical protein
MPLERLSRELPCKRAHFPNGEDYIMSWLITPTFSFDADAQTYITAVETADGQALETATRYAINNFVIGCKQDGIWDAIKASCILAGARTRLGALTPLVGTAPTSFNFVDGDYNRKTGLVGNGSTKYFNSNRNNNADPQNSKHLAVFASTVQITITGIYIGAGTFNTGDSCIGTDPSNTRNFLRLNNADVDFISNVHTATGLISVSRSNSIDYTARLNKSNTIINRASELPSNNSILVFARGNVIEHSNARLAFYSIGEDINLALLDARVTDLINAFDTAIPS